MPIFKSRLFNWIDQSAPAKLGRSARRFIDQKIDQLTGLRFQELPRLIAYQIAKAALYPVYLIASAVKRTFPALDSSKDELSDKLRSQPDSGGLLPEADLIAEQLEHEIEQNQDLPKPQIPFQIPVLLRPLAKFVNWFDRTKIQLDRNIAAIVKRSPDNLATSTTSENYELEPKLLANRVFAEVWQRQIEQNQSQSQSLKESNGLAENLDLGKNTRLEQLRSLIEAAIAYFFGNQSHVQSHIQDSNIQNESLANGIEVPELSGLELSALPDSPQSKRRRVSGNSSDRLLPDHQKAPLQTNKSQSPAPQEVSGAIKENAPLTQSSNLDRLRELITAAINYFIGKRSLDGDVNPDIKQNINQNINPDTNLNTNQVQSNDPDLLSAEAINKLQTSTKNSNSLKFDDQIERLQKLIEEAIAYFFGKQRSQPTLDETSDMTIRELSWLTMEDDFVDDNGPWPLPLEYESHAFNKSSDMAAINSSGELQNFETTTSQISQDQLQQSLIYEEELLMYQQSTTKSESDRPLRAWIEANASIMGYAYNPVMTVILWVDAIVVKIEDLLIIFWKALINLPKRLIHSIRYGNKSQK